MKVQKITDSASIEPLEYKKTMAGLTGTPDMILSGLKITIPGKENVNTGIFESSPGTYRRIIKQAEVMHILQGEGSFTPDNEEIITFKPGDTLFFSENTQGVWVLNTRLRKFYVIMDDE